MSSLQVYLEESLKKNTNNILGIPIPDFGNDIAVKLIDRIDKIRLYAHCYAFHYNFEYGSFDANDLIRFAYQEGLQGVSVHIGSGGKRALRYKTISELKEIKLYAEKLGIGINLDISSTDKNEVDEVVRIAVTLGVQNIRAYIRYSGRVSEIIEKGIEDLKKMGKIAIEKDLYFTLEQHEDLKSHELVRIIEAVNNERIGLLFDFGNMINAYEEPLPALETMAPYIRQVHLKGARRIKMGEGFGHIGVSEEEGDLPQMKMLFDLLLLGEGNSPIGAYSLEQVIDYYAPAFRFEGEEDDPLIAERDPSTTPLNSEIPLKDSFLREIKNSSDQVHFIGKLLEKLKTIAEIQLNCH